MYSLSSNNRDSSFNKQEKTLNDDTTNDSNNAYQNLEDLTVIWLDKNINNTDDCLDTKARLREQINYLVTFDIIDECIKYIKSIAKETIFLIVSGSYGETCIAKIHDQSLLYSVYVFCGYKAKHEEWAKHYAKIIGVFDDKKQLLTRLMKDVKTYLQNAMPMSFLTCEFKEKSIRNLTDEKAKFIWYQWLMETLIQMPESDDARLEMLHDSRIQYAENAAELEIIDEFDKFYTVDKAIWWYTRECFLYRLLNKALRTENLDIIFKYRFFLKDVYDKLNELHSKTSDDSSIHVVYRGQAMSLEEIRTLSQTTDGLISLNAFISTTRDKQTAIDFANESVRNRFNVESVLFEIVLPAASNENKYRPFADISSMSFYKTEQEVLLSLGSVCRVISVQKTNREIPKWKIQLELKGDEDNQLSMLKNYVRLEMRQTPTIGDFGTLFLKLGDLIRAERYFTMMLKEPATNDSQNIIDRCELNTNMGLVYTQKGDPQSSLIFYEKALALCSKVPGKTIKMLTNIYGHIGYSYLLLKNWIEAVRMFETALRHFNKINPPDEELRGTIYLHMATASLSLDDVTEAEENCDKASTSLNKCLDDGHPSFSKVHTIRSQISLALGQTDDAIDLQKQALSLLLKSLPPDHVQVANIYEGFADIYQSFEDFTEELEYRLKALEIYVKSYQIYHPCIVYNYIRIGELYEEENNMGKALFNYREASRLSRGLIQATEQHLTALIRIINIYIEEDAVNLAFRYTIEAIERTLKATSPNHPEYLSLQQILAVFRSNSEQTSLSRNAMWKMVKKIQILAPLSEIITNIIFNECMAKETTSNLAAIELLEMNDSEKLEALFKEDTIEWNEMIYE